MNNKEESLTTNFEELEALEDTIESELLRLAIAESTGEFFTLEEVLTARGLTLKDIMSEEF